MHVEAVCSTQEQLRVVEEVQDSSRSEAHQEDDEHQRAGLDVHGPVVVGLVQLAHDAQVAHNGDQQGQQEAEDGQKQVGVEQGHVAALFEG